MSESQKEPAGASPTQTSGETPGRDGFDGWVRSNPWHPRIVPFFCWIIFMTVAAFLPEAFGPAKPFLYIAQCVATVWLLWHYRKLTPELTLSFHWLAVPTGVLLCVVWIGLGYALAGELGWRWERMMDRSWGDAFGPFPYDTLDREPNYFGPKLDPTGQAIPHDIDTMRQQTPWLGNLSLYLRLIGMALIVPVFEELFIRSAMLRGLQKRKPTVTGLLQFANDLPVIGDWLRNTEAGKRAEAAEPALTQQLVATPVGMICVFGVAASTFVFMLSHIPRDWLGCIACGIVWCWLVWITNKPRRRKGETWASIAEASGGRGRYGLGPVAWSHAITNALLWWYTVQFNDWRFL